MTRLLRSIRPLVTVVLNVGIHVNIRRAERAQPRAPEPPAEAANDHAPLWTLRQLAAEVGEPEFIVARVARDLGFVPLVYDADQVAAIIDALRPGSPPRGA